LGFVLYGVIIIQPVAPMSVFGLRSDRGHGHVLSMVLIAMVGMLFTSVSCGRMAPVYPSAGVVWMFVAIAFGALKTKAFRGNLIHFDVPQEI
jgi:putrescine importer